MSFTRLTENSDEKLVFKAGSLQAVAVAICAVVSLAMAAGAVAAFADPLLFFLCAMAACAFGLTAWLVYNQQRTVEINIADGMIYVFGRQKADMYVVPFAEIAALRIADRPARHRAAGTNAWGENSRGQKVETVRHLYYLDLLRHDSGYEALDRSSKREDVMERVVLIARKTGLPVMDEAGEAGETGTASVAAEGRASDKKVSVESASGATQSFTTAHTIASNDFGSGETATANPVSSASSSHNTSPHRTSIPDTPPPGSVVQITHNRRVSACVWPLSQGIATMLAMGIVGVGLLAIGAMGVLYAIRPDGNVWVGMAAATVAGFFAYQVSWRLLRGLLCNGFAYLNHDGLHLGYCCLNQENERKHIPLADVAGFRVLAPRFSTCTLEVMTVSGQRHTIARITAGLSPLTLGDLHWLNGRFSSILASGRFV